MGKNRHKNSILARKTLCCRAATKDRLYSRGSPRRCRRGASVPQGQGQLHALGTAGAADPGGSTPRPLRENRGAGAPLPERHAGGVSRPQAARALRATPSVPCRRKDQSGQFICYKTGKYCLAGRKTSLRRAAGGRSRNAITDVARLDRPFRKDLKRDSPKISLSWDGDAVAERSSSQRDG